MIIQKRIIKFLVSTGIAAMLILPLTGCGNSKKVESGETWEVTQTTELSSLTIAEGAAIKAPEGYLVTMTVDGVETGQVLEKWSGVDYKFLPGTYEGDIVLTVAEANKVAWTGDGTGASGDMPNFAGEMPDFYPFRQALFLDKDGIDAGKSVLAAVQGETPTGFEIKNIKIVSEGTFYKDKTSPGGTGFNGIYVAGGEYDLKNIEINFLGDGRSDFVGYGTAIVAAGEGTRLVMDNVTINTQGIVRSGVIAKDKSNVIVKNSRIQVKDGVLPPDYVNTMNIDQMRSSLWISGIDGTTRATGLLGAGTRATYINSSISFEGWGGLSTDIGSKSKLTAINCKIDNTGSSGYGQYNNSSAVTRIYGCEFNVGTIGSAMDSGSVSFGDSSPEAIEALNNELGLGLTPEEIKSIPVKHTVINSDSQGVLWHGSGGALTITGGTIINTKDALFIDKGVNTDIRVDGAGGSALNPGNGVMMQVMDDDEPAYDWETGKWLEYYEEPTGPVAKDDSHDIYNADSTDALAEFSNIQLTGDFYNASRGGQKKDLMTGEMVSGSTNLGLTFDNASITGVISSSNALHYYNGKYYPKIGKDDIKAFSHVRNTAAPAVNNGVTVTMTNGAKWIVTGTSYLTKLVIEEGSSVVAPSGRSVTMTDDGNPVADMAAGIYTGDIVIIVD